MIELKRLKLINWHNFENVTFDCARLTYMIGVNAVGKTTILDAIRYCLTTNRNFNALGNKKSGRTLQGSVHAKQRGENAYRRPGHTVAYIGAEFWDSVKRTPLSSRCGWSPKAPCRSCTPATRPGTFPRTAARWNSCPSSTRKHRCTQRQRRTSSPQRAVSYTRSPSEARDRICRALGIGRASSPLGKKVQRGVPDGHQHGRDPQLPGVFVPVHPAPAGAGSGRAAGRPAGTGKSARRAGRSTDPRQRAGRDRGFWPRSCRKADPDPCEPGRGAAGPRRCRRQRTDGLAGASGCGTPPAGTAERPLCRGQKCRSGSPPGLSFRPRCRQRQRRGPGTGRPDRGAFPPQNGAGYRRTQSRKGRKCPCPHPEPAGGAAPQRLLLPASRPKS